MALYRFFALSWTTVQGRYAPQNDILGGVMGPICAVNLRVLEKCPVARFSHLLLSYLFQKSF